MKKRTILISGAEHAGYYVGYFAGQKLIAEKRITDPKARKLQLMVINSPSTSEGDKDFARACMRFNYRYVILFADNPHVPAVLKRKKALGFDDEWKDIFCPLWMATEVK